MGDASALVVNRGAAVQMLAHLDPGAGVGATLGTGRDGDDTALQRDDVVLADGTPVAEAEDVAGAFTSRQTAIGRTGFCWRLPEAGVVPGQERGKGGVGLLPSSDAVQTQFLAKTVLEGAPETFERPLAWGERAPIQVMSSSSRTRRT